MSEAAYDEFIDAIKRGRIPGRSEHLPSGPSHPLSITSTQLSDPANHWKEFLCVEKINAMARLPSRGSAMAVGYDLYPIEAGIVPAWGKTKIKIGIKISVPSGVYGRIASRSGLSDRANLEVGAGVIDADYQGELMVIIRNHSDADFAYTRETAIAQLILERCLIVSVKEVRSQEQLFGKTGRSDAGFGSTDSQ